MRMLGITLAAAVLAACSSGGSVAVGDGQSTTGQNAEFAIAYIKRALPADATGLAALRAMDDVTRQRNYWSKADVYLRTPATPDGTEQNITASVTGTAFWDAKDLDVSPDGTLLVFALRGPISANQKDFVPPSWHIWEYNVPGATLLQLTGTSNDIYPNANDVSPHFLSDGRIVFSSTRQTTSRQVLIDEGGTGANIHPFEAQTEAGNESTFLLHVMNADGSGIHQISFNQSHDVFGSLLSSGRILWTRWDNTPDRTGGSAMHLYSANPDGTDVQLLYGAQSHNTLSTNPAGDTTCPAGLGCTIEFVSAREMPDGQVLSLVRPFTAADFGGNLQIIDVSAYVENNQTVPDSGDPATTSAQSPAAQRVATQYDVRTQSANGVPVPSPGGRFNSAFPLWDGTGRVLVSWNQCRLQTSAGTIVACTSANLTDANSAAPTLTLAPPLYSAWLLNPADSTLKPVITPVEGQMITDLVSLQPRTVACTLNLTCPADISVPSTFDPAYGILDIRSVYDRDGQAVVLGNAGISLATVAASPADLRPGRFLRVEKAVSIGDPQLEDGFPNFDRGIALGGSANVGMRELLGYVPIEPDGSVRVKVPANVALAISIVDRNARALATFPRHTSWLTVRPGEILSCNGCHQPTAEQNGLSGRSHGRANLFTSLNGGYGTTNSAQGNGSVSVTTCAGDTMAQELAGTNCNTAPYNAANLSMDVIFNDAWGDGQAASGNGPFEYPYAGLTTAQPLVVACQSAPTGPVPSNPVPSAACRSIINYEQQIDPLWQVVRGSTAVDPRGVNTCTNCHTTNNGTTPPAGNLQLDADPAQSTTTQFRAYTQLLDTHDVLTVNATNQLVNSGATVSGSISAGSANASRFFATVTGTTVGTVNHAGFMTAAELRLLSEWVDIGAQYYNNPFDAPLAN
jgi:hypothetical protein